MVWWAARLVSSLVRFEVELVRFQTVDIKLLRFQTNSNTALLLFEVVLKRSISKMAQENMTKKFKQVKLS